MATANPIHGQASRGACARVACLGTLEVQIPLRESKSPHNGFPRMVTFGVTERWRCDAGLHQFPGLCSADALHLKVVVVFPTPPTLNQKHANLNNMHSMIITL